MPELKNCENQLKRVALGAGGEIPATGKRHFWYADELVAENIKPPRFVLNPIIPPGRLILGVGDSTQGKTPFGLQLARDVAGRLDFLDYYRHSGEPTRVALIDAESPKEDLSLRLKMQERGRTVNTGKNLLLLDVDEVLRGGLDVTGPGLEMLSQFVRDENIDLLVLDNLWALSGGQDILQARFAQPILHGLRKITRLPNSPSVLLFHHPRKGTDKQKLPDLATMDFARWAEEASGSRIFFNLTDVRFGLQRAEIKGEEFTIFRGRSRVPGCDQDFGPIYLTIDEDHSLASIDRRPEVFELLGDKERQVLHAMRGKIHFGMKEAKEATHGDISEKTIRRAFRHGCQYGLLKLVRPGIFDWAATNDQTVQ
ncbi:MAG: AAA family ATPase [Acidobacteriia bacterium]|nr:AAA family ATPase [Terriglobia bacterium]